MAESTEVEQDEGFVSALMLCAAAAGDSATAKAVYLAAEVRNMDHLRTIGSEAQLKQLLGDTTSGSPSARDELAGESHVALGDGVEGKQASHSTALATVEDQGTSLQPRDNTQTRDVTSFGEREYGKDTRSLSALLRAAGQAMDGNGIGTIWAGRQNQGYLCENSLRLITTRWEPSYTKSSVPSENSTKVGISALRRYDEEETDEQRKKGARKKFRGLFLDDDGVETIDEYAEEFDGETLENDAASAFLEGQGHAHNESSQFSEEDFGTVSDSSFQPSMKTTSEFVDEVTHSSEPGTAEQEYSGKVSENGDDEYYEDAETSEYSESEAFDMFFSELKEEASRNGSDDELNEEDARELFSIMQEEFTTSMEDDEIGDLGDDILEDSGMNMPHGISFSESAAGDDSREVDGIIRHMKDEGLHGFGSELEDAVAEAGPLSSADQQEKAGVMTSRSVEGASDSDLSSAISTVDSVNGPVVREDQDPTTFWNSAEESALRGLDPEDLAKIKELQAALPGMPLNRIKKVLSAFDMTLGSPSMLTLVPILRETMPDYLTSGWLKRNNTKNAEFVLQNASGDGLVDTSLLNSMLQVKTSSSSLDEAVRFHEEEFRKHKLMLVSNNRLPRALAFRQKIEEEKRTLDIPSYGSLVDYYARHGQLGSALMVLKECISYHGAPPSEKSLSKLRLICRQKDLEDDLRLRDLIGEDPIEWLRHGEKYLKREMSKKGRRDVKLAYNRILG